MRNRQGLTVFERITKDIELASRESNEDQRLLLAHMAIAAAEFAIDFGLITYQEWSDLTDKSFDILRGLTP